MTIRTVTVSDNVPYNVVNARLPSGRMVGLVIPSPTTKADREWMARVIHLLLSEEHLADAKREKEIADAFALNIDPVAMACAFAFPVESKDEP